MKSEKSFVATVILHLFLGLLGIHRMYVGKISSGIIMALVSIGTLSIGGWIWWCIDLAFIISGNFKDKEGKLLAA